VPAVFIFARVAAVEHQFRGKWAQRGDPVRGKGKRRTTSKNTRRPRCGRNTAVCTFQQRGEKVAMRGEKWDPRESEAWKRQHKKVKAARAGKQIVRASR